MPSFLQNIAARFMVERMHPDQSGFFYHRIMADHVLRYRFASQYCTGKKVLDIACGDGYGSNLLCSTATNVVGVDIDPESVAQATQKYHSSNLKYIAQDALLFLQNNTTKFDVIVSFDTIEHIANYTEFLKSLKKNLNPGGTIIISTPNRIVSEKFFGGVFNPFHIHEFTPLEFKKLVFSVLGHRSQFYYQRPVRHKHLVLDTLKNFIFTRSSSIKSEHPDLTGLDLIGVIITL